MKTLIYTLVFSGLINVLGSCTPKCDKPFPDGMHLVNTDEAGKNIAMEGYDLLTYFDKKPQKGKADFISTYQGVKYQFVSLENKTAFDENPEIFLPEYGGFCAVAAYFGDAEELQQFDLFEVVDGKLYFNKNEKAQKVWIDKTPQRMIPQADQNWNCIVTDLGLDIDQPYEEPKSIK